MAIIIGLAIVVDVTTIVAVATTNEVLYKIITANASINL